MLKLLRRKSFRKSKDLNSESGSRGSAVRSSGQYSVASGGQRRRSSSGLQSTHSLSQPVDNNYNSLDRSGPGSGQQQRHSRDNVRTARSRYSSLSNTASNSEDNPPEILQYARPPENLASPVRESNSYLPESVVASKQDVETTIQKLFFDSVVNGGKVGNSGEGKNSADQRSRSEARRSVIVRENPARRRSSSNNNNNNNSSSNSTGTSSPANNTSTTTPSTTPAEKVNQQQSESESKAGRRSVLSVLRQSFRKSKKERPRVTARPEPSARQVSACSLVEDQKASTVSVASVRAGRTLSPSRASLVSRENPGENNNQASMKTATPGSISRQLGSRPSYTSPTTPSSSSTSSSTAANSKATASPPTATPRHGGAGGQRFLPETPKLVGSPVAVPPIYANVHSSGNNRQMSPGIAKILEDSGNKRAENGVSRTQSSSQVPPSIPKPAARLSIRQKVEFQPLVGPLVMVLVYHEVAQSIIRQKYLIVCV